MGTGVQSLPLRFVIQSSGTSSDARAIYLFGLLDGVFQHGFKVVGILVEAYSCR